MKLGFHRIILSCALSAASVLAIGYADPANAQSEAQITYSIPPQGLGAALNLWAAQSGRQVFFPAAQVTGRRAPGVTGRMTQRQALKRLIAGSGLVVATEDRSMVTLRFAPQHAPTPKPARTSAAKPAPRVQQQLATAEQSVESQEIVVTGERAVDQSNIARKRQVDEIYDSVNVDDVGQLPDFNIPDAMRRIAGVSAIFDEDEGQFTTARGLPVSYNQTTYDGVIMATIGGAGDGTRNVNMQAIPTTALSRLEVYKSYMVDQDLGWVGAHFNTDTRSAYDAKGLYLVARGKLNYFTANDTPTNVPVGKDKGNSPNTLGKQAEVTISDRFGANDQFGFLAGVSYYYKNRHQYKTQYNTMYYTGADGNGDGIGDIPSLGEMRAYAYTNAINRVGGIAKLEWRPTERTDVSLTGYLYAMSETENRWMHGVRGITSANIKTADAVSGTFTKGYGELQAAYFENNRRQMGGRLHAKHQFDNDVVISVDSGYSQHRFRDGNLPDVSIRTGATIAGSYDLSTTMPTLTLNEASNAAWYEGKSYVNVTSNDRRWRYSAERVFDTRADVEWHASGYPGLGLKGGVRITDLNRRRDDTRIRGVRGTKTGITAYDFVYLSELELAGRAGQPLLMIDYNRWSQVMGTAIDENGSYEYSMKDDSEYGERVASAYAMGSYTGSWYKFTGGLRFEDVDVRGWYYAAKDASPHDQYTRTRVKGGYSALKPAISFRGDLTEKLRLKLAFSQTMGRPNPDQVSRSGEAVSFNDDEELISATRGNPNLRPRQANNFDATFEYYLSGRKNMIMLGGFYKYIKDEIVTRKSVQDLVFDGILYPNVTVRQPENAENAKVWGAEAQIVLSDLSFLPKPFHRFSINANALVTSAVAKYNDTLTLHFLPYQSKFVANAAVSYDWTDRLETRIAYNFLGGYQDGVSLANDDTTVNLAAQTRWSDWQTVDAKIQYKINDHFRVELEAKNLTNANRRKWQGPGFRTIYEENEFGQSFFAGVTYRY